MIGLTDRRAQSGLDRLILFVLALVGILLVAPILLGVAGIDINEEPPPAPEATGEMTALSVQGTAIDDAPSVGVVRVVLSNTGGDPVDMTDFSATWTGGERYALVAAGGGSNADGEFGVGRLAETESDTVLREVGDRGVLTVDLGTDDVEGVAEFGRRLEPGERVSLTVVASDGRTIREELDVPDELPENGTVGL